MRKQLFTYIIPLLVCVCCLSTLPSRVGAQTTVLSQQFENLNSSASWVSVNAFEGWTFGNCHAKKDTYLQVGSSSSVGTATSPTLGVEGNVVLLINTKQINSESATFDVSVVGSESIASTESVTSDDYRPSAILIKGCMPSTKILIKGTTGRFYVQKVIAYAISDAIFYESFNNVEYNNSNEFAYNKEINSSKCDNTTGTEFVNVKEANKKIFFDNYGHFTFPTFNADSDTKALLSFRTALIGTSRHYLNITASEGIKMASLDSKDISLLQNAYNGELTGANRTWQEHSIILTGLNSTSSLTIEGRDMFLDDVKLTPIPSGLDQSKDNSTYILANAEQVRTVTLTRSLTPNVWCPLCLPFDVTPNQMATVFNTTCELSVLSEIDTSTGVFKFNSVDGESTIAAGSPFLIRTAASVVNPTFTDVTIKNADPVTYTAGGYQFVGIYSPTYLKTDGTNLFLGTDGNLYKPGTDEGYNRLGGMRAYFVVPETASARVVFDEEQVVTGIDNVEEEQGSTVSFDLMGHPVSGKSPRGIIINKGRKWLSK